MYTTDLKCMIRRIKRSYKVKNNQRIKYKDSINVTFVSKTPFVSKNVTSKYACTFFPDSLQFFLIANDFMEESPKYFFPKEAIIIFEDDENYFLCLVELLDYSLENDNIIYRYETKTEHCNYKFVYRINKTDIPSNFLKYILFKGDTDSIYRICIETILSIKTKRINKL